MEGFISTLEKTLGYLEELEAVLGRLEVEIIFLLLAISLGVEKIVSVS